LGKEGVDQQAGIEEWTAYVRDQFPEEFARQSGESAADLKQLTAMLDKVDWAAGDPGHGRKLFETRACIQCHGSRSALGPDLHGVAQRFSRADLFTAIVLPSRDVSPRYQTTMIATREGDVYTGLIVYESADGLVLRNSTNQTFRIETKNIEARRALTESIMPNGLLKDLRPQDLADLYAYLRSLSSTAVVGSAAQDPRE
jgi:putative heme-binding domain-containing protein